MSPLGTFRVAVAAILVTTPVFVSSESAVSAASATCQLDTERQPSVCEVDVLPAEAVLQITYDGESEIVRLSSAGLAHAVIAKQPATEEGVIETELVALSLQGTSRLVGPVQLLAGRQFGLDLSRGMTRLAEPPYDLSFDLAYTINLPALQMSSRGFAQLATLRREATHLALAAEIVAHPDRRCSTGPAGTGLCDIPAATTCWEYFEGGVHKGCCS